MPSFSHLTSQDFANVAHVSRRTVKRWMDCGEIDHVKLGRRHSNRVRDNRPVRFRIGDVAKFLGVTVEDVREALATIEGGEQK